MDLNASNMLQRAIIDGDLAEVAELLRARAVDSPAGRAKDDRECVCLHHAVEEGQVIKHAGCAEIIRAALLRREAQADLASVTSVGGSKGQVESARSVRRV